MSPRHLLPVVVALLGSLAALACAPPGGHGGSSGSCVGPYVDDHGLNGRYGAPAPTVAPGGTLRLHGHWYTSTCNDAGQGDPLEPLPDVTLTVTWPVGRSVELGPVTPGGRDLGFDATLHVPADVTPGAVRVSDGRGGTPYVFRIAVSRRVASQPSVP